MTIRRTIEGVKSNNLPATLLFVDFAKAFDSIHRGKMKNILSAYGISTEKVEAVMINKLYRNTRSMVRSPDGDTSRSLLVYYKETRLHLSFLHPAIYITDTDYAYDSAITSDKVKDANIILRKIEEVAAEIGLHVNADKTEYISLNQNNNNGIKSLKGKIINKYTISSILELCRIY